RLAHPDQERGLRDHHRASRLHGGIACPRWSGSGRDCGHIGGREGCVSGHPGRSHGDGNVLPDGMERSRMTPFTTSAKDPAISIRGLSASYDQRRVLHGVDLEMHRGEIFVLLGGSGSGKTTLLKQVLGLAKPDAGTILVNAVR